VADIEASPTFAQRASSDRAVGTLDGLRGAFLWSVTGCRAPRRGGHGGVTAEISTREYWIGSCLGRRHIGFRRGGHPLADRLTGWPSTRFVGCSNQKPIERPNPANPEGGPASIWPPSARSHTGRKWSRCIARRQRGGLVWTPIDTTGGRLLVSAVDVFRLGLRGAPSPANPFASNELTATTASGELTGYFESTLTVNLDAC
jgi:hypothetical protein